MKQNEFETIIKNEIIDAIHNQLLNISDYYNITKGDISKHEFDKEELFDMLYENSEYSINKQITDEILNLYNEDKIDLDIEFDIETEEDGLEEDELEEDVSQYIADTCVYEGFKYYIDEKLDSLSYSIGNLLNVEPDTIYVNEDTINIGELKLIANELAFDIDQEPKFTKEEIKKDLNAVHQNVNMKYFERER